MFNFLAFNWGYIIVIVSIIVICLVCWFVRKRFKIGTFTKEEDVEEGKDISDDV